MKLNPLKIEDLKISEVEAFRIIKAFKEFAKEVGYREDRISDLECRSRSGFIANSFNKGGIECVAFASQYFLQIEGTGFKNADKTLEQYYKYDVDRFVSDHGYPKKQSKWTDKQLEEFDSARNEDSEATVMFGLDIMHTGKEEGFKHTANLRFTVCVKDAPYHRQYDDLISIDIQWNFQLELVQKLREILKDKQVKLFSLNVEEAY